MKTIILETAIHRNERRLLLKFDYDDLLIKKVKTLKDALWSQSKRCWHVPVESVSLDDLRNYFSGVKFEYRKSDISNPNDQNRTSLYDETLYNLNVYVDKKKNIFSHMLRHSYATHHMEKGIELRLIQETLGHASSKTTEIYTYVSQKSIKRMPNLLIGLNI